MFRNVPEPTRSAAMARILAALEGTGGLSRQEIARAAFVGATTLSGGKYLEKLKSLGLIHISGWRKNGNGFTTPLYRLGHQPDCCQPHFDTHDRDSLGMSRIVAALERHGPLSCREAARMAALSVNTVKNARYMEILVAQERVHIQAWRRNSRGPASPLFAAGTGRNAARPAPLSAAEQAGAPHRRPAPPSQTPWAEQLARLAR